jgi:hypothetical protein
MRAVCKVHGLTLLLWVRTLWRSGDGLFFEVPPLASNALLTMFHPFLKNMLQSVDHFKISCLRAPFSWLEKPRNHMGWDLDCMADVLMGFHWSTFSKLNTEFSFKVINGQQHVFEKCVKHCKKCTACQGRYFGKETVTVPPQSSDLE